MGKLRASATILTLSSAAMATSLAVSSCSSHSSPAPKSQAKVATVAPATGEPAEAAASRIEKAISAALPGGTWTSQVGPFVGAYRQLWYTPKPVGLALFHSPELATQSAQGYKDLGFNVYVDGSVALLVATSATDAEIAAVKANR